MVLIITVCLIFTFLIYHRQYSSINLHIYENILDDGILYASRILLDALSTFE